MKKTVSVKYQSNPDGTSTRSAAINVTVPWQKCPWNCGEAIAQITITMYSVPEGGYSRHNAVHGHDQHALRIYMNIHGELGPWERNRS